MLPIGTTIVHATLNGDTVVSVAFDRNTLSRIRFGYIDPSDTLSKFKHNMDYSPSRGLLPVKKRPYEKKSVKIERTVVK